MKHLILPLMLCLLTLTSFAAQIRSNGTGGGNWNNTATWALGALPVAGDQVVIEAGDSVYVTDTRTTGQLVMLMDAAGKSVFHVTATGNVTFTSTSNNIIRVDPVSFAGPYTSRLLVEGTMSVVNFAVSNDDQTTVDIDVDGTFSASGNVLWVYGGLGLNCSHTVDIGNNGTFSCGNFNMTSGNTNNDLTITNDGTFNVTLGGGSAFYANIAEDCDFVLNVNDKMSVIGVLRTATADDNSTCTINVQDTLTITSAIRMSTSGTADPANNVLNMDFANAYCSYAFPIFNGTGGSITSSALNVSTIEQKGTGAATYVQVNENTTYHNLIISNTHPSGVYILEDTFTVDNLVGNLTVSTGATFKLQGSGGTPKPLGVGGNFINNGTLTDNGSGITVKGDFTNTSVINNSGSNFDIDGNFTNTGTFNTLSASDKMDVEGNFTNSGTFDAEIDSLVVGGNFSNTANYTATGGNNIYLSGDFANTGTYNFVDGDVISFEGTATQTITGTTIIDEMVVDNTNGVNITSGMTSIKTLLTLTSGQLNTNGNMTFISDATETAALATVAGGASIIGDVTVQRYLNEGDGWYMLASPVTGATLADWNNELPMSGFTGSDEETNPWVSVYQYDETTRAPSNLRDSGYVEASNITNSLVPGEGWFVYYEDVKAGGTANTMDVTGPLKTGSEVINLTFTGGLPSPGTNGGWHMRGNPYASPVEWNLVTQSGLVGSTAYVMGVTGNYRDVVNDNVDYIYSSEAFWVQVSSGAGVGSLTFNESDKAVLTDDYNAKKAPSPFMHPLKIMLSDASNANYQDYSVLRFHHDTSFTENFDYKDGDSRKLGNALGTFPNISMVSADYSNIYYNTVSSTLESATIPLRVWQRFPTGTSKTFTVTFDGVKEWTLNNKCLTLWDSVTNVTTKLDEINNTYTFTAVDTLTAPRLFLSYSSPLEVTQTNATCFGYSDGSATVEGEGSGNHTYTWLDAAGNVVHKDKLITGSSTVNTLTAGTYTVWVTGNGDCGTVAATIEIAEPDPIIADFSSDRDTVFTNSNASVQFTNASTNAVEYFWDFGDGTTSSQENPIHTYTTGGTFTVTMIASEELCADTLTSTVVVYDNVGVDELGEEDNDVRIYQQNGQTYVAFDLSDATDATITLHDMVGREMMNPIQLNDVKQRKVMLPISSSLNGIHTVGVYMNNRKLSKKLYYHSR